MRMPPWGKYLRRHLLEVGTLVQWVDRAHGRRPYSWIFSDGALPGASGKKVEEHIHALTEGYRQRIEF